MLLRLNGRDEGAVSADGKVAGCYLHGLFAADGFRSAYLARIKHRAQSGPAYEALVESTLDGLADHSSSMTPTAPPSSIPISALCLRAFPSPARR